MFSKVILLALLATAAYALPEGTGGYTNCGEVGEGATILELDVEGCTETPCVFVKGNSYTITVKATSDRVATSLPYTVTANILGVPVVLKSGEACEDTVPSCPTTVGGEFTFTKALEIEGTYPSLTTTITASVKDQDDKQVLCASFQIKLVSE